MSTSFRLTPFRRAKRNFCSTRDIPNIHHQQHGLWKNKKKENRNDYGTIQQKLLSNEIKILRLMQKPRLKIDNEKRPRSATMRVSIGSLSFFDGHRAARAVQMKAKKTWTGFSTRKC